MKSTDHFLSLLLYGITLCYELSRFLVLLSHQFSKLQIYSVEVSNAFLSLHGLKELFNDNAIFLL